MIVTCLHSVILKPFVIFFMGMATISLITCGPQKRAYRGLLQKKVRFETYLPVGTFPRGWYVLEGNNIMKNHVNVPT